MRSRTATTNPLKPPIPLPKRIGLWDSTEEGFPSLPGLGQATVSIQKDEKVSERGRFQIAKPHNQEECKKSGCSKLDNLSQSTRCSSSEGDASRDESRLQEIVPKFTQSGVKVRRKLTLKERQKQKKARAAYKHFEANVVSLHQTAVFPIPNRNTPGFLGLKLSGSKREKEKKRQRKDGPSNPFEKCLNLGNKGRSSASKGTKPVHPKKPGPNSSKFAFANNGDDLVYFTQSQKYKTEMCKNFELKGKCKWGENCCFAHGKSELRKKTLFNYFYKTKICKHFHRNGYCPYASRCQYFHFKTFQKFQELLESFSNKLFVRLKESPEETLGSVLGKTGKM